MYRFSKILVRVLHGVGIIILGTGCTTTHYSVPPGGFEEDKEVSIILYDGETLNGKDTKIGVDSLFYVESNSGLVVGIPQSEVNEIRFKNHGLGALEGFGFGFIPGALAGAGLIVLFEGKDIGGDPLESDQIVGIVVIMGVLTGIIGAGIGVAIGHTDKYIIR